MNRRNFLKVLGVGSIGAAVAAVNQGEAAASVPEPVVDTPSSRLQAYTDVDYPPHYFGGTAPLMGSCGYAGTVPWGMGTTEESRVGAQWVINVR